MLKVRDDATFSVLLGPRAKHDHPGEDVLAWRNQSVTAFPPIDAAFSCDWGSRRDFFASAGSILAFGLYSEVRKSRQSSVPAVSRSANSARHLH